MNCNDVQLQGTALDQSKDFSVLKVASIREGRNFVDLFYITLIFSSNRKEIAN